MADQSFTLQEELLLLWLDERSGRLHRPHLRYALAAAALAELLMRHRLRLDMGRVEVRNTDPIGDEAIDPALSRLGSSSRPRKLTWWVRHLYSIMRPPVDTVAGRLVTRGALTRREHTALFVIHWTDYPVLEPAYVQRLHRRIHNAVMGEDPIEDHLAALIALLQASEGIGAILDRAEQREHERRIAAITAGHEIAYAVGKALAEVIREDREAAERAHRHVIIIDHPRRPRHPRHPRRPVRPGDPTFPGEPPGPNRPWRHAD